MPVYLRPARVRRRPTRHIARLLVELLEERSLLSYGSVTGSAAAAVAQPPSAPPTLDQAQPLGDLTLTPRVGITGTLGAGQASTADVAWYSFNLTRAARVTLTTQDLGLSHPLVGVVSLFNSDPVDYADYYNLFYYRLLGQAVGTIKSEAQLTQDLPAGEYFVALSGKGNQYFTPGIADSGYAGSAGNYRLVIKAQDLGLDPAGVPVLLTSTPDAGASLTTSPLLLRLDFSAPLDGSQLNPGGNVHLTWNPDGALGNGNDQDIPLSWYNLSPAGTELQLYPSAALLPGAYRVDLDASLLGQAESLTFQVTGVEGQSGPDDTLTTAHDLNDITRAGLLHVPGTIADDATDPLPFDQSDVDLYHFQVSGPGRYAFRAEVFAGRIGSPLDPQITLYQMGSDGQLQQIAFNDNTLNGTTTNDNLFTPLYTDSELDAGLTAGDYYVAVSASGTFFDPTVSHSGQGGWSSGDYVLNLVVQPAAAPPRVLASSPATGTTLTAPPTQLVVQFSAPINVQDLASHAYDQSGQGAIPQVYVVRTEDGAIYSPRLQSYDAATNQATFLMLDALPAGHYELHLSGPQGLTDFAGQPLVGNTFDGDYVVRFAVHPAVARGTAGDPRTWTTNGSSRTSTNLDYLGPLFPYELQAGVNIVRPASAVGNAGGDYYWFEVLQDQQYLFTITGTSLPPGTQLFLKDAAGNSVPVAVQADGVSLLTHLTAGWYGLGVDGPVPQGTSYQIRMTLLGAADWQAPLTSGPAPALRLYLPGAPAESGAPLQVNIPSAGGALPPSPAGSASGMLASLTAAPLGGVRGAISGDGLTPPDRVLVQSSQTPTLVTVVSLTVLAQTAGFGGEATTTDARPSSVSASVAAAGSVFSAGFLSPLIGAGVNGIMHSCEQAIDVLFGLEKWLETLPVPGPGARLVPDAAPADTTEGATDGLEVRGLPVETLAPAALQTRAAALGEWSWAASLAAAGIGAWAADRDRGRRRFTLRLKKRHLA
jgi:methionine-rich copper-binding protein CopC